MGKDETNEDKLRKEQLVTHNLAGPFLRKRTDEDEKNIEVGEIGIQVNGYEGTGRRKERDKEETSEF